MSASARRHVKKLDEDLENVRWEHAMRPVLQNIYMRAGKVWLPPGELKGALSKRVGCNPSAINLAHYVSQGLLRVEGGNYARTWES